MPTLQVYEVGDKMSILRWFFSFHSLVLIFVPHSVYHAFFLSHGVRTMCH